MKYKYVYVCKVCGRPYVMDKTVKTYNHGKAGTKYYTCGAKIQTLFGNKTCGGQLRLVGKVPSDKFYSSDNIGWKSLARYKRLQAIRKLDSKVYLALGFRNRFVTNMGNHSEKRDRSLQKMLCHYAKNCSKTALRKLKQAMTADEEHGKGGMYFRADLIKALKARLAQPEAPHKRNRAHDGMVVCPGFANNSRDAVANICNSDMLIGGLEYSKATGWYIVSLDETDIVDIVVRFAKKEYTQGVALLKQMLLVLKNEYAKEAQKGLKEDVI